MLVLTKLRQIRERQGWSQRDLVERAEIAQSTVVHLERGKPARFITMRKLAKALNVEPSDLVGEGQ